MQTIELSHVGHLCPWTATVIDSLRSIAVEVGIQFVTNDQELATIQKGEAYFPFCTVVNCLYKTPTPIFTFEQIQELKGITTSAEGDIESFASGQPNIILPLSDKTVSDSIAVCCNGDRTGTKKETWYRLNSKSYFGLIAYDGSTPAAILEWVEERQNNEEWASSSGRVARVVCVYSNHRQFDFRESLFERFEVDVRRSGYSKIRIVSGERESYPNGTLTFMERIGFTIVEEIGSILLVGKGVDRLYLMEERL